MSLARVSFLVHLLVLSHFAAQSAAQPSDPVTAELEQLFSQWSDEGFVHGEGDQIIAMGNVAKEFLLEKLETGSNHDKGIAIHLLGRMRSSDLIEPLAEFLANEDLALAIGAAQALGNLGFEQAVLSLCSAWDPTQFYLSQAILTALLQIGNVSAVEKLREFAGGLDSAEPKQRSLKNRAENVTTIIERYHANEESRRSLLLEFVQSGDGEKYFWALRRIRLSYDNTYIPVLRGVVGNFEAEGPGGSYNDRGEFLEVVRFLGDSLSTEEQALAPPIPYSALAFVDTLISYTNQARLAGWITDQATTDKYSGLFSAAASQLQQEDFTGLYATLNTVLYHTSRDISAVLSVEAYGLLRFNTRHLLRQLPPQPGPEIATISPNTATAGDEGFILTVNGLDFIGVSAIHWNDSSLNTIFVSSTQLQAAIAAFELGTPGSVNITVVNPDGMTSNHLPFTITEAPPENILAVPLQYATIQAAVDAAQPGYIVEVSPGFYDERVSVSDKDSITVRTTGGIDGVTCKRFLLKQSHQITIKGFVIDASGTSEHGIVLMGGNNQNSDVTLEANEIKNAGNDFSGISIARGNPRTRIANNRIHNNGRNGIRIIDATGGPHYLINNTIVLNGWNGVDVARQHVIYLVNNILSFNGTKSGSTGGRYGVSREGMTGPGEAPGITLLNNLLVGNNGKITTSSSQDLGNYAQTLDPNDIGNLTTAGTEGSGVSVSPSSVFADIFVSQTPLDLHLNATSVAIDRGLSSYNPPDAAAGAIPTHDFGGESRPHGVAVDLGADERQ